MLEVSKLTKKYGKVLANEDLNFTLPDSSITVLLGPNGAGKSTAIKSIIGFLKYKGQITVEGIDNKSVPAKKLIGYVPEMPALYPNLTVMEHLDFIARAYKLNDYKDYANELLRRMELDEKRKNSVMNFPRECSKNLVSAVDCCQDQR